jgi:cytoskeletal protein CcmA (bactofilin family)
MKYTIKAAFLLVLLAVLALPGTALAKGLQDDKVVAGGSFTLKSGETIDGNLFVFGGAVTLEQDSDVKGDVVLMGGTVAIDGTVTGSVVGIGGVVSLRPNAVVAGDLTTVGATLNRDPGAQVEGQVVNGLHPPFQFSIPGRVQIPDAPNAEVHFSPIWSGMWFLFRTFLWAALAVLLVMFLPNQSERTALAAAGQPLLAGAVGLLTVVVAPLLLIAIAITIILIPVSLVGGAVLAVAWFLGRIALGLEVGRRLAVSLKQDWPLAVAAGVGTFLLTLVVDGMDALIPCVGWLAPFLVGILGLGAVLLTRFGTQTYPPLGGIGPIASTPRPFPPAPPVGPGAVVYEAPAAAVAPPAGPPADLPPEPEIDQ